MKRYWAMGWVAALAVTAGSTGLRADDEPASRSRPGSSKSDDSEKKFRDFADVTKGATRIDGFLTLHHKDDHLYAEIKPNQFNQPMLAPIAIARGMAMAGQPLNFGDEWILVFKRVGDKVQLIRRNIHYKAPAGTPLDKAVKQNYTDSVLMALPIQSINHSNGQSVVIDLADIFFTDFAELGFGPIDRSRTHWHKIKAFPNNIELEVEVTYGSFGRFSGGRGDSGVADGRGRTLVIHYSLDKLPEPGYKPRYADTRVGYFLSALKDFGLQSPDTNFVRQINRWRIEKSDPKAKVSPPKKQLIWYVEDTVPLEYRPYVEAGILEWNKAFEKIGIRNALAVRWQEDGRDDFDPEDINYCTFRWITTSTPFAMSCLRANPLTGEMIDGDVIFDASWIHYWKEEYAFLTGTPPASGAEGAAPAPIAFGQVISPMMAAKQGFGLPGTLPSRRPGIESALVGTSLPEAVPAEWNEFQTQLRRRQMAGQFATCQYSLGMRHEMGLAALSLVATAASDDDKDKDKDKDKDDKDKDKDKEKDAVKLPEEFLGQLIKEVVMHEVGHSLGLRHNFKASSMLNADQLNDQSVTRVKGQAGSVMDYNPVNIAPKGQKQGDYVTTTIGPYDYWAIEYAYSHIDGDEAEGLKKIASRSPDPDLVYATDEDMYLDSDPLVNVYDLGSDTLRFAKDRTALASQLLKDLDGKVVKDGESWSRVRVAFSTLLGQWGNAAYLASSYIGGQSISRDHKGGKGARDPNTPISGAKQREALTFVTEQILSDKAFKFSPALLRRLAAERWYHWGNESILTGSGSDYPINQRILAIQKIVLNQCFDAGVLSRLQNQELQVEPASEPLKMAEVFRVLTDGIWSDVAAAADKSDGKARELTLSTIRRNLQREHLRRLSTMVLGNRRSPYDDMFVFISFSGAGAVPADARSLARLHLKDIRNRIGKALEVKDVTIDDTTRAHLEECHHNIAKVLEAGIEANEP